MGRRRGEPEWIDGFDEDLGGFVEVEARNPLLGRGAEAAGASSGDEDEEDERELQGEVEKLPDGIAIPHGKQRERAAAGARGSKRGGSSRRRSTRRRGNKRASVQRDFEELEGHELFAAVRQGSSGSVYGDLDGYDDDGDDEEEVEMSFVRMAASGDWRSLLRSPGLGGGALNVGVVAALGVPPLLAALLVPIVSRSGVIQLLMLMPLLFYLYVSSPVLLGWAFATGLRFLGPLNGYPFHVGALSVTPWIKDWRLYVRVLVQDASFGNPPGFPFESFVQCRRVDIEGSFPLAHLWNLIRRRKVKVPLRKVPDFERYIKFDFNHIEVDDAMCNFQMFDGKFNINEFTRILANGEVDAVLPRGAKPRNQLVVRVLRAKHLDPHRGKKTCDPYVVVRCRRQEAKTHTQNKTLHPMWNEELVFHVDDASTVIEVAVYDRDTVVEGQAAMIGHWAMTTKYLVTDPTYCWHHTKDFHAFTVARPAEDGATGFEGWVPLASKKWKRMGLCGQLQLEVLWKHVPEDALQNRYVPERRYTALEQLSMQSQEDRLRFGDWARVRDWLNHEPFCYDIRRFTVRGTRFYIQDLFRGHKGKPETLVNSSGGPLSADCVKLPILEMRKQFRPKNGDEGITSYDAFVGFFIGILTSAARSGRLGGALAQVLSGGMFNFGYKFKNLLTGQLDKAMVPRPQRQILGVASQVRSGIAVMHQNVTQSRRNRAQFKIAVEANDTDFLSREVELCGHLDRCAVKVREEISNQAMADLARRRGNFKTKYFELKGDTLFYRKHKTVPKGFTYNLTYKIELANVYSAVFSVRHHELLLFVQEDSHVVRLRDASVSSGDVDAGESNVLKPWLRALREHEIPLEEFP